MEHFYFYLFGLIAVACGALEVSNAAVSTAKQAAPTTAFSWFRNNYLLVYSMMMAGDWLQGPYVYALYQHYGYSRGDIGKLFIAGFGSSMIFGTIVGSLGDRYGRKKASLLYGVTYIVSCMTKHSSNFYVLLFGRFTGGIATSLLFSAFESWLVAEHFKRNYDPALLGGTFSKAIFLGNGLVAILAGLLANFLVLTMEYGPVSPFDAAAAILLVGTLIVAFTWSENYGEQADPLVGSTDPLLSDLAPPQSGSQGAPKGLMDQFKYAADVIMRDKRVALLGAMQSLFEGSMYTFVFLWTPSLSPRGENIPHGFIFATFMMSTMVGSSFAARLMARADVRIEGYMPTVFLVAAGALTVPVIFSASTADGTDVEGLTFNGKIQMCAFLVFEACVGLFWPSMMKMRSQYVPEEVRSTIINFFRIPLNLFVCVVLYNVSDLPLELMFLMCTIFLVVCAYLVRHLGQLTAGEKPGSPPSGISSGH